MQAADAEPGAPVTYDDHHRVVGPFFHGTRCALAPGIELVPGYPSNFQAGRVSHHLYFTTLISTAAWGAQLAAALGGDTGRGHVYAVQPTGPFEDDPNVTDKKFPGNPTRSYRTRDSVRILAEVEGWPAHSAEALATMLANLARLREQGLDVIDD